MKGRIAGAGLLLALSQLVGCGPTPLITDLVIINYTQVGNTDFSAPNQQVNDGMFMRYHIDSIVNMDTNAHPFHFDPTRIVSQQASGPPIHTGCFVQDAVPVDVAAHQSAPPPELFGVTFKVAGDPASLKSSFVFINYQSAAGEHVLMAASTTNVVPNPDKTMPPIIQPVPYKGNCTGG